MNIQCNLVPAFVLAAVLLMGATADAQSKANYKSDWTSDWDDPYTIQALLGAMKFKDLQFEETSEDGTVTVETDTSLIPQLGGDWATLPKGGIIQYGLECSFLLGFQVDEVSGRAGGGGLYVKVESSMWMFDLAGGPYLNIPLGGWGRIYGGAGPLLMYIDYDVEREEEDTGTGNEETYSDSESAFGVGVYARAGVEFRVHERGYLGVGARGVWVSIDLSSVGGTDDISGIGGFVTYTAGF
ncbi:MAG: hypothetical protein K9M45_12310 [Kiritimatiellales bacterium]|nr:hypothetical protein [Kiritimatiellales bacterium]